eukprot:1186424-Prorocentrum_minimum.AAC.1
MFRYQTGLCTEGETATNLCGQSFTYRPGYLRLGQPALPRGAADQRAVERTACGDPLLQPFPHAPEGFHTRVAKNPPPFGCWKPARRLSTAKRFCRSQSCPRGGARTRVSAAGDRPLRIYSRRRAGIRSLDLRTIRVEAGVEEAIHKSENIGTGCAPGSGLAGTGW